VRVFFVLAMASPCLSTLTVELYGGGATCQGQALVAQSGAYGNICDDGWGLTDADAVCSMIGAGTAVATTTQSRFGVNSMSYLLTDVACSSSNSNLNQCSYLGQSSAFCATTEIAGVVCSSCVSGSNYDVRLVGGTTPCEGHVMVYYGGGWGYLQGSAMSSTVADTICRSAGFSSASTYYSSKSSSFGPGPSTYSGYRRFSIGSASCSSTASSLSQCAVSSSSSTFSSLGYTETRLAGVKCTGGSGDACLFNSNAGVYVGGTWYTSASSGSVATIPVNWVIIGSVVVICTIAAILSVACVKKRRGMAGVRIAATTVHATPAAATTVTTVTSNNNGGYGATQYTAQAVQPQPQQSGYVQQSGGVTVVNAATTATPVQQQAQPQPQGGYVQPGAVQATAMVPSQPYNGQYSQVGQPQSGQYGQQHQHIQQGQQQQYVQYGHQHNQYGQQQHNQYGQQQSQQYPAGVPPAQQSGQVVFQSNPSVPPVGGAAPNVVSAYGYPASGSNGSQ